MKSEQLRALQPTVIKILENALEKDKLSHAYLFVGEKGTCTLECALWLIGKLINRDLDENSEEALDNCRRLEEGTYADCMILDGISKSIKKEEILKVQERFSKTALEKAGWKAYILNGADNATTEACNSLLKFLEEPQPDTLAVLITDKQDHVLETLVSRCQTLTFRVQGFESCYEECLKRGMDEVDSYCLAHLVHNSKMAQDISESEGYQAALNLVKSFTKNFIEDPSYALFQVQSEGYLDKNRALEREILNWFIELLSLFYRDCICSEDLKENWYKEAVERSRKEDLDFEALIRIVLEGKDKFRQISLNPELVMDEMILKMKEVRKWKK